MNGAPDEDEFRLLADNAAEGGLSWAGGPAVTRSSVEVAGGRRLSALVWGTGPPEAVLIHGGGQNAHTWDTVALALDRPVVAVDLPGHGHSGWRDDGDYRPEVLADDVAAALGRLAPSAVGVAGMSLGGLVTLCLRVRHPELVSRVALIDITPGTDRAKAEPIMAFLSGPERFANFQEMLDRTIAFNPGRSASSLRRGVIHNARPFPDGSWGWRWDPAIASGRRETAGFATLWSAVGAVGVPLLLIRGQRSAVVSDADAAQLLSRQPHAHVKVVADAGHSVQGDQPVALARLLAQFLDA